MAEQRISISRRAIKIGIAASLGAVLITTIAGVLGHRLITYLGIAINGAGALLLAACVVIIVAMLLLWCILWIIFPVFVYFGIRRVEKVLALIERNTR